jgi:hypothetical protein
MDTLECSTYSIAAGVWCKPVLIETQWLQRLQFWVLRTNLGDVLSFKRRLTARSSGFLNRLHFGDGRQDRRQKKKSRPMLGLVSSTARWMIPIFKFVT